MKLNLSLRCIEITERSRSAAKRLHIPRETGGLPARQL